MNEIIELSWKSQVVFVGGYLAYVIAFSGRRGSHTTNDTIGILVCFGGLGLLSIGLVEKIAFLCLNISDSEVNPYLLGTIGVVTSILSAILWRAFLQEFSVKILQKLTGSKEDGLPSAWATLLHSQKLEYSQLVVTLKSGVTYESYPLGNFNEYPDGPCTLGSEGSIGMYVTYITDAEGKGRKVDNVVDGDGARITYIPSSEIAEVDLRRRKKDR